MIANRLTGALKGLFGGKADPEQCALVKKQMQDALGDIHFNTAPNGKIRAFFEKQTLAGDYALTHTEHYRKPRVTLDMQETVGTGRTREDAIMNLWTKMIRLPLGHIVLQLHLEKRYGDNQCGLYGKFNPRDDTLHFLGTTHLALPPARPEHIEESLILAKRIAATSNFGSAGQIVPAAFR